MHIATRDRVHVVPHRQGSQPQMTICHMYTTQQFQRIGIYNKIHEIISTSLQPDYVFHSAL